MNRLPLLADFILLIVLCASFAYWGMVFFTPQSRPLAPPAQQLGPAMPSIEAAAGLFGGQPDGAALAGHFRLIGVIAAGPDGVAILSPDGKPAQVVGVGMQAAPGVTVNEVYATHVLLNAGGMSKRIDLPENAKGGLIIGASAGPSGAPMPAPVINASNGQTPSQQQAAGDYHNIQLADQHPLLRRPSGMGPPAGRAKPTMMPAGG